ncbi:iron ABC transporter permease [Pseudomonadales bacterium]|jgi:iron complex transport system permease protein|nr:iron ABC transporter permease [Pseudomonadales bacterium]
MMRAWVLPSLIGVKFKSGKFVGLGVLLVASFVAGLSQGAVSIPLLGLVNGSATELEKIVFAEIRAPRVFLAGFVGASLALSGAVLQGLFRNPLADPGLIGVSSGAAVGAISMIVLGAALSIPDWAEAYVMPLAAMSGAMVVTFLLYSFANYFGRFSVVTILLVGIALNAMAGVVIGLFQYVSDDAQLRTLVFWLMGSFSRAQWASVLPAIGVMVGASLVLLRQVKNLDRLQLGESEAYYLGVDVPRAKRHMILCSAAAVGAGVSLTGIIGFVGLVVPHLARLFLGSSHRLTLAGSVLIGASLMILADLLARTVMVPEELPVSLVTNAIGAPFFLWLIARAARS